MTQQETFAQPSPGRRIWFRVRMAFRYGLHRVIGRRLPGAIRPFEIHDKLTGQHLRITVSGMYTILHIDGRDYYFWRWSGGFDGTGSALCTGDD